MANLAKGCVAPSRRPAAIVSAGFLIQQRTGRAGYAPKAAPFPAMEKRS
jgi:hypothetical protein